MKACIIRKKSQARPVQPTHAHSKTLQFAFPQFSKTVRNFSLKEQHAAPCNPTPVTFTYLTLYYSSQMQL